MTAPNRYRIMNRVTKEWWVGQAPSAEEACQLTGWLIGDCWVSHYTPKGSRRWKKTEKANNKKGATLMTAPPKTPPTRVISLRLPTGYHEYLKKLAEHYNTTPAKYAREVIIRNLQNVKEHSKHV